MVAPPPRLEPFPTCGDTYDPGGCPCGPGEDAPPPLKAEKCMKLPMLPCHSAAATVGMVMMSTVSNMPMPPCCHQRNYRDLIRNFTAQVVLPTQEEPSYT